VAANSSTIGGLKLPVATERWRTNHWPHRALVLIPPVVACLVILTVTLPTPGSRDLFLVPTADCRSYREAMAYHIVVLQPDQFNLDDQQGLTNRVNEWHRAANAMGEAALLQIVPVEGRLILVFETGLDDQGDD
jgi:hypothetical protein